MLTKKINKPSSRSAKLISWKKVNSKKPAKLNLRGLNLRYSDANGTGQMRLWQ